MNPIIRHILSAALIVGALAGAACSTTATAQTPRAVVPQEELEQLLAPVALYPDALLTQILIAATYPLEVVQAARFIDRNPNLNDDALSEAARAKPWDESVKALLQTPAVLVMMNDKLDWTQQLGDAFLEQRDAVMDTVQTLREQARASGSLASNTQQRVVIREKIIIIEPTRPNFLFVPYYDPFVVYGGWHWHRRPWYWEPPIRYRPVSWGVTISSGISWSVGIGISHPVWHARRPDWHARSVTINNNYYASPTARAQAPRPEPTSWQHRPDHREEAREAVRENRHREHEEQRSRPDAAPDRPSHTIRTLKDAERPAAAQPEGRRIQDRPAREERRAEPRQERAPREERREERRDDRREDRREDRHENRRDDRREDRGRDRDRDRR